MGHALIKISTNRFFSRLIVVKTVFEKLADRLKEIIMFKKNTAWDHSKVAAAA